LPAPKHGTAFSFEDAKAIADEIGYPVLARPSYVQGGRGMEIVYDETSLASYLERHAGLVSEHPVLLDRFLDDAVEIDVDALCQLDCAVYDRHPAGDHLILVGEVTAVRLADGGDPLV
ncbi:flavin reductase, partial [Streptomyces sp. BE20]|uniref:flavin reductase family protein n=1 Tax=Streptomyces sp. BE20 TaxID=3002525 RepID=UPI002E770B2C